MNIPSEEDSNFLVMFTEALLNVAVSKGDKTAAVLQKSLALREKDTKICTYFMDNRKKTSPKNLKLAINLYTQMNQLFDDFMEKLNIKKGENK